MVHSTGGTLKVRGEGEEANQRCVYTTRSAYTHKNPVVGFPHQTPDMPSVWLVSLVRLVRTWILHPFLRNFSPRNSYLTASPQKSGRGGWAPKGVLCAQYLSCPIIKFTITDFVLLQTTITGHYGTSPKYTQKTCLSDFCDVTTSINFSHESIDMTLVGLDKAKTEVKLCIVMDPLIRSLQPGWASTGT